MKVLIPGILMLALALGLLLLLGPHEDAVLGDPAPRVVAPRVASVPKDPVSLPPTGSIPFARYEVPSSPDPVSAVEPPSAPAEAPQASTRPPVLSGVVVDAEGQRVMDSLIVLFFERLPETPEDRKLPCSVAATCEGAFAFDALHAKEGHLEIRTISSGIQASWIQTRIVPAREGDHGLVISVVKGGAVSGRVDLADSGFSHDKLQVRLRHRNAEAQDMLPPLPQGVALAPDGTFGFGPVPTGFVDIEILLLPFSEVLAEVPAVDVRPRSDTDDSRLDPIILPPARRADLRVVDRAGVPIREFTVLAGGQVIERPMQVLAIPSLDYTTGWTLEFASAFSILLGTRPQTLRILAPGYVPKVHELTGDAVVELSAAPSLQVTLDPTLIGPLGAATKTTFLTMNLEPEGIPDLPTSSFMLQGTLGFDTATRTFSVPTLGPGRYRLRASLITNRGGFG
jgi:hypothetical protein